MPELSWSEFEPFSAAVEIRFDHAYLLWDRAGALWAEVRRTLKDLEPVQGSPNQTVFRIGRRWQFACEMERARVIDQQPDRSVEEIASKAHALFDGIRRVLEVSTYKRIGFRPQFRRVFERVEDASAALLNSGVISFPERQVFGNEGQPSFPEVAVRWNGKAHSVTQRIKVEERRAEVSLPGGPDIDKLVTVKKESVVTWSLDMDIDYFTVGEVLTTQWNSEEWLRQAMHVIRRDSLEWLNRPGRQR